MFDKFRQLDDETCEADKNYLIVLVFEVGGLGSEFLVLVLKIFYSLFVVLVLEFPLSLSGVPGNSLPKGTD